MPDTPDNIVPITRGARSAAEKFSAEHDRELLTILFTDLVDSTKLQSDLGNVEAARLVELHRKIVRDELARYDAREIEWAGDSCLAVFTRPSEAVTFALRMQAEHRRVRESEGRLPLVCVGMHLGEIVVKKREKKEDLFGLQVSEAARVMSVARGDQIFCTRAVFDNARGSLRGETIDGVGDVTWVRHGLYSLKGCEDPMEICEVVGSVFGRPRAPEANDKCRPFESSSPSAVSGRSGKLLGIVALALVVLGVVLYRSEQPLQDSADTWTETGDESIRLGEPLRPRYSPIALPADQPLAPAIIFDSSLALSPDGNLLVYRGMEGSSVRLYQRRLGQLGGAVLEGTSRADRPFFSPDGEWIGYIGGYDGGLALLKMPVAGGPSELIQKLTIAFPAHWGDDGHIVYTPTYGSGLMRISEDGGEPEALTTLEEGAGGHSFPFVLPGSKAVLYTSFTQPTVETAKLMLYDRETKESRLLFDQAGGGKYIETGHLVYSQRGRLMAAPFDLDSLTVTGPSFDMTDLRMVEPDGTPNRHAISSVGTFAYVPVGMDAANGLSLIWVDLNGNETDLGFPLAGYQDISIAPNGRDALVVIWNGQDAAIWLYDLERLTAMRLTFSPSSYSAPRWMNDGYRFFYTSNRTGNWVLHLANLDDPDNPRTIVGFQNGGPLADSVTADQRAVIFTFSSSIQQNLMIVDLDEEGSVRPLLESSYNESSAALSSDGKWIAYASDESGEWQVYMRSYPEMTGKTRVSIDGGDHPRWSPDGKTLYFRDFDSTVKIMAVPLSFDPSLRPGTPHVIYEGDIVRAALHPDGDRFLVVKQPISGELRVGGREIIVVENWFEEVRRRERMEAN